MSETRVDRPKLKDNLSIPYEVAEFVSKHRRQTEMPTSQKVLSDDVKMLHRNIYIRLRTPELRDELKKLQAEKQTVFQKLATAKDADAKQLKHRRIFLTARIEALRHEQTSLAGERDAVRRQLKRAPGK
jgi:hypothetical protein